jgi:hypothetical protein
MYLVNGDELPLEMLTADEANDVLPGLCAEAARTADGDNSDALASSITEVTQWIDTLAEEAAAEALEDAAAEHAADLFADHLAGI